MSATVGMLARLAGDRIGPDEPVLQLEEARQVVHRQAEQRQEHLGRERDREPFDEVDLALLRDPVDQILDQLRHRCFQGPHPLEREERIEKLAVVPMPRRVDLEGDERTVGTRLRRGHA